jgi:pyruvate dehydrogenase E2 component (dihydrolipoamide acetyltransferase)
MFGVSSFSAIVNPPQACILAVGASQPTVVVNKSFDRDAPLTANNQPYATSQVMTATVSCDHRVVDGAVGAEWLSSFKGFLEDPETMLL